MNSFVQLGDRTHEGHAMPAGVHGSPPVRAMALGEDFSCGSTSMAPRGAGAGASRAASNDEESRSLPVRLSEPSDIVQIAAAPGHVCARDVQGDVFWWGANGGRR